MSTIKPKTLVQWKKEYSDLLAKLHPTIVRVAKLRMSGHSWADIADSNPELIVKFNVGRIQLLGICGMIESLEYKSKQKR